MDFSDQTLLRHLLLIAGVQGLVLAGIILCIKPRILPNRYLGAFFLLFSLGCLEASVEWLFYPKTDEELPFPLAMPLAYLPVLFLHFKSFINPAQKRNLLNTIPYFLPSFFLDFLSFYLIDFPGNTTGFAVISNPSYIRTFEAIYSLIFIAHTIIYALMIFSFWKRNTEDDLRVSQEYHRWFRILMTPVTVFWLSWVLVIFVGKSNNFGWMMSYLVHTSSIIMIYSVGYTFILRFRYTFAQKRKPQNLTSQTQMHTLMNAFREQSIHRIRGITLNVAAKELGCTETELSNGINHCAGVNFNEFINQLRVEDFKKCVHNPGFRRLSLYGIAQEVGFSSKTSFYRAFKRISGLTPKEYLDLQEHKV